jgi:hypothetical protein
MNTIYYLGAFIVLGLMGAASYWYVNPNQAPGFLRGLVPGVKLTSPQSPMNNFRPPQF